MRAGHLQTIESANRVQLYQGLKLNREGLIKQPSVVVLSAKDPISIHRERVSTFR